MLGLRHGCSLQCPLDATIPQRRSIIVHRRAILNFRQTSRGSKKRPECPPPAAHHRSLAAECKLKLLHFPYAIDPGDDPLEKAPAPDTR